MYISATLPYNAETLIRFFISYLEGVWPLQIIAIFLISTILWCIKRDYKYSAPVIGTVLSFFWLFVGYVFYISSFSSISFMAPYFGMFFMLQAFMIFYVCVFQTVIRSQKISFHKNKLGLVLVAVSLLFYPAFVFISTKSFNALPVVGITPIATSLYTLGILNFCILNAGKKRLLSIIPILHIISAIIFSVLLLV